MAKKTKKKAQPDTPEKTEERVQKILSAPPAQRQRAFFGAINDILKGR